MLELRQLCAGYGPVDVLEGISLTVPTGACVCLIGANGAGKTTTLSTIAGLIAPSSGDILFEGEPIRRVAAEKLVQRGVSLVPEGRRVVSNMSVEDNLLIGAYTRSDDQIGADLERVYQRFSRLRERRRQFAGQMSGGEQQMLAIGRALMARPKLLLLDQASMGLAPQIVSDIFRTIREINNLGTTILLVEQNARKALSIASYGYVLESGRISGEGAAADLLNSPQIVAAYLGGD
ncbi:ABC transporter ATP-binding protein [Rhodopseudomonas sp. B29]|uniref:ABC transporter ATP-binding protein n=1 Tax=Rhodopseudomonas sp. B29 TaxID=95607 RepID=UPI00034A3F5E|nr:ABC transporter ATP-binding protein [Rhodopseudomonas sp. B29]